MTRGPRRPTSRPPLVFQRRPGSIARGRAPDFGGGAAAKGAPSLGPRGPRREGLDARKAPPPFPDIDIDLREQPPIDRSVTGLARGDDRPQPPPPLTPHIDLQEQPSPGATVPLLFCRETTGAQERNAGPIRWSGMG